MEPIQKNRLQEVFMKFSEKMPIFENKEHEKAWFIRVTINLTKNIKELAKEAYNELISTLFQILSAISIGYLFVIIFYKGNSLIPCIITHALFNAFSVFYVENSLSVFINLFLIIIPLVYAWYINKNVKLN